ncbi:MAG: hypothetical protein HZA90_25080 [Verrucomicrobia bacterium]|nr:hypothetical protein [Verrucomicrobiota bacterium]
MSTIPTDIYERVHEFAVALANTAQAEDDALHAALCLQLRAYYDEQASLGRSHPFLTEALADHTDDPAKAARLYELALDQARAVPDEPTHTKMISLAERLLELGQSEQAEPFLTDGRAEAVRRHDAIWVGESDSALQRLTT